MNDTTKAARVRAFTLRKAGSYSEALAVLRAVWTGESDPVAQALLKIDAAFALVGLKQYSKALKLAGEAQATPGLGTIAATNAHRVSLKIQKERMAGFVPTHPDVDRRKKFIKWKKSPRRARIREIAKKFVPSKFKGGTRKGWRKDVGF